MKKEIKHLLWGGFIIIIAGTMISQEVMRGRVEDKIEKQRITLEELKDYNEALTNTLNSVDSDDFIYQQARSRLKMLRDNEILIVDISDKKAEDVPEVNAESDAEEAP